MSTVKIKTATAAEEGPVVSTIMLHAARFLRRADTEID
jgi:hypothetical protein